jgi:hypothetical protein
MTALAVTGINANGRPRQPPPTYRIRRRENWGCSEAIDSLMFQDNRIRMRIHVIHSDEKILCSVIGDHKIDIGAAKRPCGE